MVSEQSKRVGNRLKALRKERAMTLVQLTDRAEISYRHYGDIERGVATPTIDLLSKVAKVLKVKLSDLVD